MRSKTEIFKDAKILYEFHSACDNVPIKADIIIALGSHDIRVADYAAELYKKGYAQLVVCTGGLGKITDGLWSNPEAVVFANRCIELGVPENKIIMETEAKNTGDNFTLSKKLLTKLNIFPKTGLIVCKPYMAKRAWATGTKQWSEVQWVPTPQQISFENYLSDDTPLEREINVMVGDLQRLKVYAEKAYQAPVEVPDEIWRAYERLVADGYDEFVIK